MAFMCLVRAPALAAASACITTPQMMPAVGGACATLRVPPRVTR
jgi:hypothetical protein